MGEDAKKVVMIAVVALVAVAVAYRIPAIKQIITG